MKSLRSVGGNFRVEWLPVAECPAEWSYAFLYGIDDCRTVAGMFQFVDALDGDASGVSYFVYL